MTTDAQTKQLVHEANGILFLFPETRYPSGTLGGDALRDLQRAIVAAGFEPHHPRSDAEKLPAERPTAAADTQDQLDAQRYRKLMALMQQAYDDAPVEVDGLTVYCSMRSGYKGTRTVDAQLLWKDARDEPLNLSAVLDKLPE